MDNWLKNAVAVLGVSFLAFWLPMIIMRGCSPDKKPNKERYDENGKDSEEQESYRDKLLRENRELNERRHNEMKELLPESQIDYEE